MNGCVFYDGPSKIDGARIVMIATGFSRKSDNAKTGDMIQTWILRADVKPSHAVREGLDVSICGDCIHRGQAVNGKNIGRTCYVTVHQAPQSIFNAWLRGRYPEADARAYGLLIGRKLRIGAYGDPSAVPSEIWHKMARLASGHAGYTHQWRQPFARGLETLCMASVDSESEAEAASAAGWRYFRVSSSTDLAKSERLCPASPGAGNRVNCAQCLACAGADGRRNPGMVIKVHGSKSAQFKEAA